MLYVKDNNVMFGGNSTQELNNDTRCVICSYIKNCKVRNIPDEEIEKDLCNMIVQGFNTVDQNQMIKLREIKDDN